MTDNEVLREFRDAGALLEGHFILSSGLHSAIYLQCARVLMEPQRAQRICLALADKARDVIGGDFDLVVSPAMGGVIVGYETARQIGCPAIFFERVEGHLQLRRGFEIPKKARCLMVEDIVTTGLSSRECIESIKKHGGKVAGAACLIDRSGGKADVGVKLVSLARLQIKTYKPDDLPSELADIPAGKPGSRGLV
jgi:orotate phosphoribosyltransferase